MTPNTTHLRGILVTLITAASALWCASSAFGNVRLAFDSTSLNFGSVAVSGAKDLTIEAWDTSLSNIEIDQFTLGGLNAGDFSVLTPNPPLLLTPGGIHTKIIVQFSPQALGSRSGSLLIETSDGNVLIPLTGTGAGKQSSLAWSVPSIDFGTITPGSERDSIIELYSTGTDTAFISALELAAADTSFAEQAKKNAPPIGIAPGDSMAVLIAFRGLIDPGLKNAQLSVLGSISNSPTCELTGDVELGSFEIQPNNLMDFGAMYAGEIRDSTFFLINTGPFDLSIGYLSLSPSGDDFTILNPPSMPILLAAGDTLPITVRANPGQTTSHASQLQVISESATLRFQADNLTVSIIPNPVSAPSNQDLIYYCASGAAITSDTVPVTNTGTENLVITGLTFADTNVRLAANIAFPDTILAGSTQHLILDFTPSATSGDTQILQFLGGEQVMFADTIALHPSVANVAASLMTTASGVAHQTIAVGSTAPLLPFDLDSIVVHLSIQDSNVASIDPSTIALNPLLSNATITSIQQDTNGYTVIISSTSPISLPASTPLLNFSLDRFVAATDSTNISVAIETPERTGCIVWSGDTTQAGGLEACGSTLLRNAILQRPLILSAALRQTPVTESAADLMLDASEENDARYELSNALGETVFQSSLHIRTGLSDYSVPLAGLGAGAYIIRLLPANGSPVSVRFLLLH